MIGFVNTSAQTIVVSLYCRHDRNILTCIPSYRFPTLGNSDIHLRDGVVCLQLQRIRQRDFGIPS